MSRWPCFLVLIAALCPVVLGMTSAYAYVSSGRVLALQNATTRSDNSTTIKVTDAVKGSVAHWCSDCGLSFELDFDKAFADIPIFSSYFVDTMAAALGHTLDVTFQDIAPSPHNAKMPFVVFRVCAPAKSTKEAWLTALQQQLSAFYSPDSDLPLVQGQDDAMAQLQVYQRAMHGQTSSLSMTSAQSVITLVAPDSNGLPSIEMELVAHNTGKVPVTVYAVVCYDMAAWRDTVLSLAKPEVIAPNRKASLAFAGPMVPKLDVTGTEHSEVQIHLVQSSGRPVEMVITTVHTPPATSRAPARPVRDAEPIVASHLALPTVDHDAGGEQVQPIADALDEFDRVRNRLHGQQVPVVSTFPSESFKAFSACLVLGVVLYTSYFVYGKLRNKSTAWKRLAQPRLKRMPNDIQNTGEIDEFDNFEEDDSLLVAPARPAPIVTEQEPDPHHVWGQSNAWKSPTSSEHSKPLSSRAKVPAASRGKSPAAARGQAAPADDSSQLTHQLPPPTAPVVVLDASIRIHPKRFESLWGEYVERAKWQRPIPARLDANTVMTRFYDLGLVCMASGSVQLTDKYLFYTAEAAHPDDFYFCDVAVQFISLEVDVAVRSPREMPQAKIDALVGLVKTAIQELTEGMPTLPNESQ
ncbi:hypothetical protein ACHHYP_00472 [Achlya hypogyna]|uniref:Beta-adaptin appendage C-terminal subdomain domain-containing protein n=1 Tax=Achlya hypogyna TaxID=1202772 RepID=A0A1V9ZAR0_ACHHY|nr:hypothetical protein ACHHYP_00472 [Achlya hypogyna]